MEFFTRNILIRIGAFLGFLGFIWYFGIRKTQLIKVELNELKKNEVVHREAPIKLLKLKRRKVMLDSILNSMQIEGNSTQNNLLAFINDKTDSSSLKIVSFSEPHYSQYNEKKYVHFKFKLQGVFNDIHGVINELENEPKYGSIAHLSYMKKKNYKTGKHYLTAEILIKKLN